MMLLTDVGFMIGLTANLFIGSLVAWGLYSWVTASPTSREDETPPPVIPTHPKLTEEQKRKIRESWQKGLRSSNNHRFPMSEGVDWRDPTQGPPPPIPL